jgi:uncharacterized protein YggE
MTNKPGYREHPDFVGAKHSGELSGAIDRELILRMLRPTKNSYHNGILPICSALAALFMAVGAVSFAGIQPVAAQEQRTRSLMVSGQGIVSIPTSLARVSLGVEIQGKNAKEVQEEVARKSSAVVQLLRSQNVEKLETTGIRLNPVYDYQNNQQRLTGYIGTNTVSFRVVTEKAGDILDAAVNAGATRIDGIGFVATDEAIASARQQALRAATNDALQQADTVLAALNLSRREIINIQVNAATPPPEQFYEKESFARSAADSTPVIGGEQQIQANVSLEIKY